LRELAAGPAADRGPATRNHRLHIDGLDVDPRRALAIAQRYVDGEISVDELTGAIALSTDGSDV
jgi:hypothetical protein